MNWDDVEHNWNQFRGDAKQKWSELTESDLDQIGGKRDVLVGKVAERYGISRDEAEQQLYDFESTLFESEGHGKDPVERMTEASVIGNVVKP